MMGTQQEAGRMNRITFFNSRQRLLMENFVYNRKKNNRIKIPPNETIPNATNVYSAPFPKTKNSANPLFIFSTNENFQLQGGLETVSLLITEKNYNKIASIVFDIIDAFDEAGCSFKRIGYLVSKYQPASCIEKAKRLYLNLDNVEEEIQEFNLSWYKKINDDELVLNAWERIITDTIDFNELLVQYDINTLNEEEKNFDMKFIKKFFELADSYIESRDKFNG